MQMIVQSAGRKSAFICDNMLKILELPNKTWLHRSPHHILWDTILTPGCFARLAATTCASYSASKVSARMHYDMLTTKPIWKLMLKGFINCKSTCKPGMVWRQMNSNQRSWPFSATGDRLQGTLHQPAGRPSQQSSHHLWYRTLGTRLSSCIHRVNKFIVGGSNDENLCSNSMHRAIKADVMKHMNTRRT